MSTRARTGDGAPVGASSTTGGIGRGGGAAAVDGRDSALAMGLAFVVAAGLSGFALVGWLDDAGGAELASSGGAVRLASAMVVGSGAFLAVA
ncbi:MAG: hypothetical protein SNJ62_10700 [Chloracidobacterium sp.]